MLIHKYVPYAVLVTFHISLGEQEQSNIPSTRDSLIFDVEPFCREIGNRAFLCNKVQRYSISLVTRRFCSSKVVGNAANPRTV